MDRMFQLFDENGDDVINFVEFICGLSILCTKGDRDEKLLFSFKIYDVDKDKKISRDDLRTVLEHTLEENKLKFRRSLIDQLVESTFNEAEVDADGYILYEGYCKLFQNHPYMLRNMTVNIQEKIAKYQHEMDRLRAAAAAEKGEVAEAGAEGGTTQNGEGATQGATVSASPSTEKAAAAGGAEGSEAGGGGDQTKGPPTAST